MAQHNAMAAGGNLPPSSMTPSSPVSEDNLLEWEDAQMQAKINYLVKHRTSGTRTEKYVVHFGKKSNWDAKFGDFFAGRQIKRMHTGVDCEIVLCRKRATKHAHLHSQWKLYLTGKLFGTPVEMHAVGNNNSSDNEDVVMKNTAGQHKARPLNLMPLLSAAIEKEGLQKQLLEPYRCSYKKSVAPRIRTFALKAWHLLVVLEPHGHVVALGKNTGGECGTLPAQQDCAEFKFVVHEPIQQPSGQQYVRYLYDIHHVASGSLHSVAASRTKVYAWGNNIYRAVGLDQDAHVFFPREIEPLSRVLAQNNSIVAQVTASAACTMMLDSRGMLYAVGKINEVYHTTKPLCINNLLLGSVVPKFMPPPRIAYARGGDFYGAFVTQHDGKLYTFVNFAHNTIAQVSATAPVVAVENLPGPVQTICTGSNHMGIVLKDGRVFVMGSTANGRIGIKSTYAERLVPVELPELKNLNISQMDATGETMMMCNSTVEDDLSAIVCRHMRKCLHRFAVMAQQRMTRTHPKKHVRSPTRGTTDFAMWNSCFSPLSPMTPMTPMGESRDFFEVAMMQQSVQVPFADLSLVFYD